MAIQFPDLSRTDCQLFRACGRLLSATKQHRDIVHAERPTSWMRSSIKGSDAPQLVLACFGGQRRKPTDHVHIDVVRRDFYKKKLPGTAVPLSRIKKVLKELNGQEMGIKFEAHFLNPPERLPRLVRATNFSTGTPGGMKIKTYSVSFEVSNAPIDSISWIEEETGGRVWTIIEALVKMPIEDDYLVRAFNLLTGAFDRFVMGSNANA